jgi:hypothetical protein
MSEHPEVYPHDPLEWCDRDGAEALKRKIAAQWPGYVIKFEAQRAGFTPEMRASRVDVRSNMVNGLPRELYLARRMAGGRSR